MDGPICQSDAPLSLSLSPLPSGQFSSALAVRTHPAYCPRGLRADTGGVVRVVYLHRRVSRLQTSRVPS